MQIELNCRVKDQNVESKVKVFQSASSIEVTKGQNPLLEQKKRSTEKIKKQMTESFSLDEEDQPPSNEEAADDHPVESTETTHQQ